MFDSPIFGFFDVGDGGGVDLDALEQSRGADEDEEEAGEETEAKPAAGKVSREEVDKWLRENGYTAYDVNDPQLKKLYDENHSEAGKAKKAEEEDLDELLVKNPKAYAAKVAENARQEMGEATKLTNQILRELQKAVPDLDQEDFDRLSEEVSSATLEQLRDWKKRGSVVTAGKAATFDRQKNGGAKRAANTNTERASQGAGESRVPTGLQPKLKQMGDALRAAGIDVKDEDIAGSTYMPARKGK